MAVNPIPKKNKMEKKVREFISKGATVSEDASEKEEWKTLSLRIPPNVLNEIDLKKNNELGISRNTWILQAILEKLKEKE